MLVSMSGVGGRNSLLISLPLLSLYCSKKPGRRELHLANRVQKEMAWKAEFFWRYLKIFGTLYNTAEQIQT